MLKKIKQLIHHIMPDIDVAKIKPESRLYEDLMFDSLSLMMLSIEVEREFKVRFTKQITFLTIKDLMDYLISYHTFS